MWVNKAESLKKWTSPFDSCYGFPKHCLRTYSVNMAEVWGTRRTSAAASSLTEAKVLERIYVLIQHNWSKEEIKTYGYQDYTMECAQNYIESDKTKKKHTCKEEGVTQARICHHQHRAKNRMEFSYVSQLKMRKIHERLTRLTGVIEARSIEAEPKIKHPPGDCSTGCCQRKVEDNGVLNIPWPITFMEIAGETAEKFEGPKTYAEVSRLSLNTGKKT